MVRALSGGTPFTTELVCHLGGDRYHVLTESAETGVPGARSWQTKLIPAQATEEQQEPEQQMGLSSWHDGAGFSYAGMPNTYERAKGFDMSAPGRATTWAMHATGDSFTTDENYRGWAIFFGSRLYILRGRYVYWYAIDTDAGVTWSATESTDFGAGKLVGGRPAVFKGRLYVPVIDSATDTDDRFWELTTVGAPDVWTKGPEDREARCFTSWHNQSTGDHILVRGTGNEAYTVAGDPMTAADWSSAQPVGDSSYRITDFATWRDLLVVLKTNGLFTVSEIEVATNELPDLESSVDTFNGVGTTYSNAWLLVPHKAGLIRWQPNTYMYVGPQQEGALEADITQGWGRVQDCVTFGKYTFLTANDTFNDVGSIYSLEPPRGERGPVIPHHVNEDTDGFYEGITVVQDVDDIRSYLVAIHVEDGTTVTPHIWQLPRNDYPPGSDPTIVKARDDAHFYTPRVFQPGRELSKSWRKTEFWLEANPESSTPGVEVYYAIDGGSENQMLDGDGNPVTFRTTGFKEAWFPTDAVGAYVQLAFKVPEKGSGEVDAAYTIRDAVLYLDANPEMTSVIEATIVCGPGEYVDKTSSRRTPTQQLNDILALASPQSEAIDVADPWGNEFSAKLFVRNWREATLRTHDANSFLVDIELRKRVYS